MNYLRIVSKPFVRNQGFNLTIVRGLRSLGQPTPETHPYLMKEDEVTPGISKVEYELRRTKLITSLPEKSKVILFGHKLRYMSHKIFYPFHQNTDFLYLTGYNQPDAVTVLEKDDSTERGYTMSMFVQPKKPEIELWEGARAGLEAAVDYFGADEAHEYAKFGHHIRDLFNSDGPVYVDFPDPIALYSYEHAVKSLTSKENESSKIKPLAPIIQEHRLFKSKAEARLMRESGEISGKSFIEIMKATRPGVSEQTISALFEYECRQRGSQMLAYVPVVAGGKNALTMHYVSNNQALREGDLLLVDAGGEYNGYASDITRTWPVNGKFSKQQKDLYKAVLNVQKQCIKMCTESNNNSLNRVHDESVGLMKEELGKLGFKLDKWDVDRILYPHHVGHYLGLDLHDTFDMTRSRKLQSGMVVTIEPGLYVPYDDKFPKEYQGIGIRIEDNVLVGKEDPVVLSVTAPKEVEDIEFVMNS